jgi:hypothetical protein
MRLPFSILEPLVERRAPSGCSKCAAPPARAAPATATLTDLGRDRTREYLDVNSYIGPRRFR